MPRDVDPPSASLAGSVLVAFGMALVVLGLFWKTLVPDEVFWSEAQAEHYQQAYNAAHEASIHGSTGHGATGHGATDHEATGGGHSHSDAPAPGELTIEQAKAAFEEARQELAAAQRARGNWGKILAASGALAAMAGLWVLRRQSAG